MNKFINGFLIAVLGIVVLSCDSNNVDPFGSAKLKVVNAAPNSGSQKFVLANIPYISDLDFLDRSVSYLNVSSGKDLIAQYRDENDNDKYAEGKFNLDDDQHYTVYLIGESREEASVRLFQDNLTAPASGKAKVKFIHLSNGAPSVLNFSDDKGTVLTSSLGRYNQSGYTEITAGSIAIQVSEAGQSEILATLAAEEFAAGKIYTVYLIGSSASTLSIHTTIHN
ncbi:MAG: DUF4397 domain-containing protein [Flavobacterium sp.]